MSIKKFASVAALSAFLGLSFVAPTSAEVEYNSHFGYYTVTETEVFVGKNRATNACERFLSGKLIGKMGREVERAGRQNCGIRQFKNVNWHCSVEKKKGVKYRATFKANVFCD